MKIIISATLTSTSGAKGSVRMTPEQIKTLIVKRKGTLARLSKVKRPTDKTKARIERNKGRVATLTTKLKIALKNSAKTNKTPAKPKSAPVASKPVSKKRVRPAVTPVSKGKKVVKQRSGNERALRRVNAARKAYTTARLDKSTPVTKLESLKHTYTSAFKSYNDLNAGKSESAVFEIDPVTITAKPIPGRMDPVVLAYNHIMGIPNTTTARAGSYFEQELVADLHRNTADLSSNEERESFYAMSKADQLEHLLGAFGQDLWWPRLKSRWPIEAMSFLKSSMDKRIARLLPFFTKLRN